MRIKVSLFCTLATKPSWQTWLFEFDQELYREYMERMQVSRGCTENARIMEDLLPKIEARGGLPDLEAFLEETHPTMLKSNNRGTRQDVFGKDYVPGVLTYPRREVIHDTRNIEKALQRFTASKAHAEFIIIDDEAYVEYLEQAEMKLLKQIPESNWKIRQYRARSQR